jgi:hypothetical protein
MVKQLTIFLANQPGVLTKVCGILAKEKIDIRALNVAETIDFGLLRLIVNNPDKAAKALNANQLSAIEHEVIGVEVEDTPGGLYKIAKILSDNKINVEYLYAFVSRKKNKAYVVLRTDDLKKTQVILEKNKVRIVSDKEIEDI